MPTRVREYEAGWMYQTDTTDNDFGELVGEKMCQPRYLFAVRIVRTAATSTTTTQRGPRVMKEEGEEEVVVAAMMATSVGCSPSG